MRPSHGARSRAHHSPGIVAPAHRPPLTSDKTSAAGRVRRQTRARHRNPMPGDTAHKVALITGGGSGIGRAACVAFGRQGCIVVAMDVDAAEAAAAAAEAQAAGAPPGCSSVAADVSSEADVKRTLQHVRTTYGRLDFCLNNAGIEGERARVEDYSTAVFDCVMSTNVRGVFLCLKHQVPLMLETAAASGGGGAIVITSSTAGLRGMPEFSAYSASKHALVGLMRSAAAEVAGRGLRINCINPATTATPMVDRFTARWPEWQAATYASYPLGRIATAQEVAEAAVWMCTSAGFMTGQTLVLDGGASCGG